MVLRRYFQPILTSEGKTSALLDNAGVSKKSWGSVSLESSRWDLIIDRKNGGKLEGWMKMDTCSFMGDFSQLWWWLPPTGKRLWINFLGGPLVMTTSLFCSASRVAACWWRPPRHHLRHVPTRHAGHVRCERPDGKDSPQIIAPSRK